MEPFEKLTCCGELMFVGLLLLHSIVCVDCLKAKTTWWNANNASSGFTIRVWEWRAMKRPTSGVAMAACKKAHKLKNLNQFKYLIYYSYNVNVSLRFVVQYKIYVIIERKLVKGRLSEGMIVPLN